MNHEFFSARSFLFFQFTACESFTPDQEETSDRQNNKSFNTNHQEKTCDLRAPGFFGAQLMFYN